MLRPERSVDLYSRGAELTQAILKVWKDNDRVPYTDDRCARINANCEAVMVEFDLTMEEWHHWCGYVGS